MTADRLIRLTSALLVVLLAVVAAPPVVAEAPTEVAVITPDPSAPLAIRVASELRALGLRVIFVQRADTEEMGPATLEATAQSHGAFAAVRVVHTGQAVEVWIADRTTGKTVVREVVGPDQVSNDADVALGAVELLRASLLELQVPEHRPRGEVEPAPEVLRVVPPPTPRAPPAPGPEPLPPSPSHTTAALGITLDPGSRGFQPGYGPQVLIAHRFGRVIALEGLGTVVFARIDEPYARATTTASIVGMAGTLDPDLGHLHPRLGAGFAVTHLQAQGAPSFNASEYAAHDSQAWLATPYLRVGVALDLNSILRWRVDTSLLASLSKVNVLFAEERVATWGRPTLLASSSLELVVH